jgi:hypothetical protein
VTSSRVVQFAIASDDACYSRAPMNVPGTVLAVLVLVLMLALGTSIAGRLSFGLIGAALLASMPLFYLNSHGPIGLAGMWPVLIAWLLCVDRARATPVWLSAAGLMLGLGLNAHPVAMLMMPLLLLLTVAFTAPASWDAGVQIRRLVAPLLAFAVGAVPFAWFLSGHPEYFRDAVIGYGLYDASRYNILQGAREMSAWVGLTARTEVYWDSFDPGLLFLPGGTIGRSLTNPEVFLLPFAVLLPAGLYRIVRRSPTPTGWLSIAGFLLAPLPSALTAQPPEPRRLLLMAPFAAVIAAEGVLQLWSVQGRWRAIVARAAVASVPLCFVIAYLSR